MGDSSFHRLCDSYLFKLGYKHLNSIGLTLNADKPISGTPDTLITDESGKYVFSEYSSQQSDLFRKFKNDIEKCLNPEKTGIEVDKISQIIVCYTGKLSPAEIDRLRTMCKAENIEFREFGLDTIATDTRFNYPLLANEHLGLELDSGQILSPEDFTVKYQKSRWATTLDNKFLFRSEELDEALTSLDTRKIVTISGKPGCGKTRLALELVSQFVQKNPEYKPYCVFDRGGDFSADIAYRLREPGKYLIVLDDANRLDRRLSNILALLADADEHHQYKFIITVRDYALDLVSRAINQYEEPYELELQEFSDDQIKELMKSFGINHGLYIERIVDIAGNNPRLAVMASQLAIEANSLEGIRNAENLYQQYFGQDDRLQSVLKNPDLLKAATIISFLRYVDRSNEKHKKIVVNSFHMPFELFWASVTALHRMEAVDLYENEVVKISDQILATYLLFESIIERKLIQYELILTEFFPTLKGRVVEATNPLINTFDHHKVVEAITPAVQKLWRSFEENNQNRELLELFESYWYVAPNRVLAKMRQYVHEKPIAPYKLSAIRFDEDRVGTTADPILRILSQFSHFGKVECASAVELLLDLAIRDPINTPIIISALKQDFKYHANDPRWRYERQRILVNALEQRLEEEHVNYYGWLFLATTKFLLIDECETSKMRGRKILFTRFRLTGEEPLFELRALIWKIFGKLLAHECLRKPALNSFEVYLKSNNRGSKEILADDVTHIRKFLEPHLPESRLDSCYFMQQWFSLLKHKSVDIDDALQKKYCHESLELLGLLFNDRYLKMELKLSHDEFYDFRVQQIQQHIQVYSTSDLPILLQRCQELHQLLANKPELGQLRNGILLLFYALAEQDQDLFIESVEQYLSLGEFLQIIPHTIVNRLLEFIGVDATSELLTNHSHKYQDYWRLVLLQKLPEREITEQHAAEIISIYKTAEPDILSRNFSCLLNYLKMRPNIIIEATEILVARAKLDKEFASPLSELFREDQDFHHRLEALFSQNTRLLFDAYVESQLSEGYVDYDGWALSRLIDIDPAIILIYITRLAQLPGYLDRYTTTSDFTVIWDKMNAFELVGHTILELYGTSIWEEFAVKLFVSPNSTEAPQRMKNHEEFISYFLGENIEDFKFIQYFFNILSYLPVKYTMFALKEFLGIDVNPDHFRALQLEPFLRGGAGSAVSKLEKELSHYQTIAQYLEGPAYVDHRAYIEDRIARKQEEINNEKKSNFIDEF